MDWGPIIAGALAGFGTGLLANVVGPHVNWGIEKKRKLRQQQTKLISEAYDLIYAQLHDQSDMDLVETKQFIKLKPFLSEEALKEIEKSSNSITIVANAPRGVAGDPILRIFSNEVKRLEKEWKLL